MGAAGFEQQTAAVREDRRAGGPGVAVCLGALAVVALVGFAGRLAAGDGRASLQGAQQATSAPSGAPAAESAGLLELTDPVAPPAEVAGIAVRVRGRVAPEIHQIRLILVKGHRALARQTVDPTRSGLFGAAFTLGPPRADARLTLVAIGLDRNELPLVAVRRPVMVAALRTPDTTGRATDAPRLGEDGVLGSRGVDVSAEAGAADGD